MSSLGITVVDDVRHQGAAEDLDYTFDFTTVMAADSATIPSADDPDVIVTVTKESGDGSDFATHSVSLDGTSRKVQVWCRGGSVGDSYLIRVVADTGAQVYQKTLRLRIRTV